MLRAQRSRMSAHDVGTEATCQARCAHMVKCPQGSILCIHGVLLKVSFQPLTMWNQGRGGLVHVEHWGCHINEKNQCNFFSYRWEI